MCIAAGGPVYRLISKEQAIIRAVATTLSLTQITSAATKALVRDMRITMHDEYGIGIAGKYFSNQKEDLGFRMDY